MTTAVAGIRVNGDLGATETVEDGAQGWYFYGVTRRGPLAAMLEEADSQYPVGASSICDSSHAAPLQLLEFSRLAAVVRPVRLADFTLVALRTRLQNASALEASVRSHNHVIEAIHAEQGILPAKFGMVYTHAEDVVSALRTAHDTLLRRLGRLQGCDEWAIHLFADGAVARKRISTTDAAIQRLHNERAAASPGRAYFLEQQLRDELDAATERALSTLAQRAFERMASYVVAGQVNPLTDAPDPAGEVEILRAAFLVRRGSAQSFAAEARSIVETHDELRCDASGPWPPYSFAAWDDEETA
jgi:hypothetical protein